MSTFHDWPEWTTELSGSLRNLRGGTPEVMKAFSGLAQAASQPNALDGKTKELIALAIGVAVRCDDCIAFHVKAAVDQGATKERFSKPLAWRFIWVPDHPLCMQAMRLRHIRSLSLRKPFKQEK